MSEETLEQLDLAQASIDSARAKMKRLGDTEALDIVAIAQSHIDQARQAVITGGDVELAMDHVEMAIAALSSLLGE